jgi:uncharacterized integral membrane protein
MWAVLTVTGLSCLAIVLFGIRNLTYGKVNPLTVVLSGIPVIILAVLGFVTGDWSYAGIMASLITLAFTSAALLLSGMRGLIA